jgi:protein-L-isoaspartate(D-aspartate) O-methyltransferase
MADMMLLRERMVAEQIAPRGVTDPHVLQAMRDVPRERFVDPECVEQAYEDRPLPIAEGQTISQPFIVALMAQAAEIKPSDRVLEIGSGSGYGAAVLSYLASRVWSIERHPRLARMAGSRIAELGRANVTVLRADGSNGWPPAAPFDAIIVTAGGPVVPEALKQQLSLGGRLIIPVGPFGGGAKADEGHPRQRRRMDRVGSWGGAVRASGDRRGREWSGARRLSLAPPA